MAFNTKCPKFTGADELMKVKFDEFYDRPFAPDTDFHNFLAGKAKDMGIHEYEFIKYYL